MMEILAVIGSLIIGAIVGGLFLGGIYYAFKWAKKKKK